MSDAEDAAASASYYGIHEGDSSSTAKSNTSNDDDPTTELQTTNINECHDQKQAEWDAVILTKFSSRSYVYDHIYMCHLKPGVKNSSSSSSSLSFPNLYENSPGLQKASDPNYWVCMHCKNDMNKDLLHSLIKIVNKKTNNAGDHLQRQHHVKKDLVQKKEKSATYSSSPSDNNYNDNDNNNNNNVTPTPKKCTQKRTKRRMLVEEISEITTDFPDGSQTFEKITKTTQPDGSVVTIKTTKRYSTMEKITQQTLPDGSVLTKRASKKYEDFSSVETLQDGEGGEDVEENNDEKEKGEGATL